MKTNHTTQQPIDEGFSFSDRFISADHEDYLEDIQTLAMDSWPKGEFLQLNNLAKMSITSRPRNAVNDAGSLSRFVYSGVRLWITKLNRNYVDSMLCLQITGDDTRGVPYYLPKVTRLHKIDVALYPGTAVLTDETASGFKMVTSKLDTATFAVVPVPIRLYLDTGRVSIRPFKDKANFGVGDKTRDEMFDILFACLATIKITKYVQRSRRKLYDLVRKAALCTGFTHILTSTEVGHERAQWASIFDTLLFHRLMEQEWAVELLHSQSTSH
jgi:hypothetical protein